MSERRLSWLGRADVGAHQERCCSHSMALLCPGEYVRSLPRCNLPGSAVSTDPYQSNVFLDPRPARYLESKCARVGARTFISVT